MFIPFLLFKMLFAFFKALYYKVKCSDPSQIENFRALSVWCLVNESTYLDGLHCICLHFLAEPLTVLLLFLAFVHCACILSPEDAEYGDLFSGLYIGEQMDTAHAIIFFLLFS